MAERLRTRPSELLGISCRYCAYRLDEMVIYADYLASQPSEEEQAQSQAEDEIAAHRARIAEMNR